MASTPNVESKNHARQANLSASVVMRQVYLWVAASLLIGTLVTLIIGAPIRDLVNISLLGEATQQQEQALESAIAAEPLLNAGLGLLVAIIVIGSAFLRSLILRTGVLVKAIYYILIVGLIAYALTAVSLGTQTADPLIGLIAATVMTGVMTLLGYLTKLDLSRFSSVIVMALIGLIVATVLSLALRAALTTWLFAYVLVIAVAAISAFEARQVQRHGATIAELGGQFSPLHLSLIVSLSSFLGSNLEEALKGSRGRSS